MLYSSTVESEGKELLILKDYNEVGDEDDNGLKPNLSLLCIGVVRSR